MTTALYSNLPYDLDAADAAVNACFEAMPGIITAYRSEVTGGTIRYQMIDVDWGYIGTVEIRKKPGNKIDFALYEPRWPSEDEAVMCVLALKPLESLLSIIQGAEGRNSLAAGVPAALRALVLFDLVLPRDIRLPSDYDGNRSRLPRYWGPDLSAYLSLPRDEARAALARAEELVQLWRGFLYKLQVGHYQKVTGDMLGQLTESGISLAGQEAGQSRKSEVRPGRRQFSADEWAIGEIKAGRAWREVFSEWVVRPDVKARELDNPTESFRKNVRSKAGKKE